MMSDPPETRRPPKKPPQLGSVMERLRRKRESKAPSGIERLPRDGRPLSLSSTQQRLWFIEQLHPGTGTYNIGLTVALRGTLDRAALGEAFRQVAKRHESLRTAFDERGGTPFQVIVAEPELPMPLIDVSAVTLQRHQLAALVTRIRGAPFDLRRAPLLRTAVLRRSPTEHVLVVSLHHIVGDGWSVSILIREAMAFYRALLGGGEPRLPALPIRYADYAAWQRKTFDDAALAPHLDFWLRHLEGSPPVLDLPGDRPRPAVRSHRGALHLLRFSVPLTAELNALARRCETTLFVVLMAAFQSLLQRWTGQDDFVIGVPVAHRHKSELRDLIGYFANTLALRVRLAKPIPFVELLERLHELMLEVHRHESLPFELLVEKLQPERSLSHTPLFQVLFTYQNVPMPRLELPGLILEPLPIAGGTALFDLTLHLEEGAERLAGWFEYSTDLFDATTLERLEVYFRNLLAGLAAAPAAAPAGVSLMSAAERHQVLVEWNDTRWAAGGAPERPTVPGLFAAAVRRHPEASAVLFDGEVLSYAGLNARANRLAHHLRGLGVGPETRVGVALERSPDLVTALLGILKAGGAYVPLDPDYPRQRLAYMMADARLAILLTHRRHRHRLEVPGGVRIVELEARLDGEPEHDPPAAATDLHAAYMIFTSGSTGRPKATAVPHRGVCNRLLWIQEVYPLGADDRVLQKTPFTFDVSVWELFWPLISGAALVVARPDEHRDPAALARRLERQRVTVVHFVPSMLGVFLEHPGAARGGASLRRVFVSGEALTEDLSHRFFRRLPLPLENLYGPTEASIEVTHWRGRPPVPGRRDARVSIGRPIGNLRILVLDRRGRPVPLGVAGELAIGGVGVARGYFRRPQLTAERFVPEAFDDPARAGARLYRSGDLARFLNDGQVEFLGRLDHQVKVRGFRIELGEIESRLLEHATVREAVVTAEHEPSGPARSGATRLVAYTVAADPETPPRLEQLRPFLRESLPEYMVPAALVVLAAMPLGPSGKLDRRALPRPRFESAAASFVAPRTPTEDVLAGIWTEVLGLARLGVGDNFFELGGHSLLASQVISRAQEAFGLEIPMRCLFEAPTVADLAAVVEARREQGDTRAVPPLVRVAARDRLPLSFAQERLWFLDQLVPESPAYNVPALFRLRGALDAGALERAFHEVIRRHEVLRTVFPTAQGTPRAVIRPAALRPLPVVDLTALGPLAWGEARRRSAAAALRPFSLARGPLLRSLLWRVAAGEHFLFAAMHHIVSDGWSVGVLMRETAALYQAFRAGAPSPLAALAVQYGDFAAWQRAWLGAGELERQLAYWRRQLAGAPEVLELPLDRPRPARQTYRGNSLEVKVPAPLAARLAAASRRNSVTLYMTLLGAFTVLLGRWSGEDDVVVGSPVAGRTRPEIEGLVGFFVNTLPLRIRLAAAREGSFRDLLAAVREAALGAYHHQDLPFEKLVSELGLRRHLSHAPLCQVMLALDNTPAPALPLPDLEIAPVELANATARFELSLGLREAQGELAGSLRYNSDLFEATTMRRVARQFELLLAAAADDEQRPWRQLPLMDAAETHQLLVEWNPADRRETAAPPFHLLFAERARDQAEAVALRRGDRAWSYRELDERAGRLAAHLRSLGLAAESRVGLHLPVSPELVVGILGTFKAGGAFVPLEPSLPAPRLSFLVRDAAIDWIVSGAAGPELPPELAGKSIRLDRLPASPGPADLGPADPWRLAYVIYTSGSTGQPKGVMVEHRSLVNYLSWVNRVLLDDEARRIPATTRPSFDAALKQLLAPLMAGAEVWLPNAEAAAAPEELLAEVRRRQPVVLNCVPALWRLLLERLELAAAGPDHGLRRLLVGGESLSRELVERTHQALPGVEVLNLYGPTEATANATAARLRSGDPVTLGRPIARTRAFVLDRGLRPVAQGQLGELCLAGPGLARGYLARAALTAEKFLPCPFPVHGGERLYRSGDLVRFLPAGEIEFRGRIDQQVKVRGLRIEPGEIESALLRHPAVREAVVVAWSQDGSDDRRLVAYLAGGPEPPAEELRRDLHRSLPEYMVPAAFVWCAALPLTATGKIDRRALPEPARSPRAALKPPRDEVELRLLRIWEELLGARPIGVDESFFELGGHSILAVRLAAAVERAFGVKLALARLFEAPSVERLAATLRRQGDVAAPSPLVELRPGGSGRPFFCVHPVGGNVFCYLDLVRHLSPELPFYALQCVAAPASRPRLETMAAEYLEAVRRVQRAGPYALGGWSMGGAVAFEMARQLEAAGEEVALVAMIDAGAPGGEAGGDVGDAVLLARFAGDLAGLANAERPALPTEPPPLEPSDALAPWLERIRREVGLGPDVDAERLRELFAIFRSNLRILLDYEPGTYGGPIVYFRSADTVSDNEADVTRGWRHRVRGGVDLRMIPGDHYSMLREPHVRILSEQLGACLAPVAE